MFIKVRDWKRFWETRGEKFSLFNSNTFFFFNQLLRKTKNAIGKPSVWARTPAEDEHFTPA